MDINNTPHTQVGTSMPIWVERNHSEILFNNNSFSMCPLDVGLVDTKPRLRSGTEITSNGIRGWLEVQRVTQVWSIIHIFLLIATVKESVNK